MPGNVSTNRHIYSKRYEPSNVSVRCETHFHSLKNFVYTKVPTLSLSTCSNSMPLSTILSLPLAVRYGKAKSRAGCGSSSISEMGI